MTDYGLLLVSALQLSVVVAGFCLMLGLRRLAGRLLLLALLCALAPTFAPWVKTTLAELPSWVTWRLVVGMAMALLSILGLRRFLTDVFAQTLGILLAETIRFLLLLPFRAIGAVFHLLLRRGRRGA